VPRLGRGAPSVWGGMGGHLGVTHLTEHYGAVVDRHKLATLQAAVKGPIVPPDAGVDPGAGAAARRPNEDRAGDDLAEHLTGLHRVGVESAAPVAPGLA
jgi:hypothetical protein